MPRGPQKKPYPTVKIDQAIEIPQAIRDNNAGKPMNRVLLAQAMGRSPSSSGFRMRISASARFGFTKGSYSSEAISLTPLGEQLTFPRDEAERLEAIRTAFRKIPLFGQLLQHFNNNKLPAPDFLANILNRPPYSVNQDLAQEAAQIFLDSGRQIGYIRDIGGSPYVVIEAGPAVMRESESDGGGTATDAIEAETSIPETPMNGNGLSLGESAVLSETSVRGSKVEESVRAGSSVTSQFFVAHGSKKAPLDQLKKILDGLGIPYVVAVDEPHSGRPVPKKVRDLIAACSAGIFIFSADERFLDQEGNEVLRPRENVVYELGAASYAYENRIVIFKEKGVTFPSDFRDLGYIEFDEGNLEAKSMDLIRELIALQALKLVPSS